jgi:hypothetical protein
MDVIKIVGSSGQISLGKKYAGKAVMVSEVDPGVWTVKLGRFIPDNEQWLYASSTESEIDQAIGWAEEHPAHESDIDALEEKMS